MPASWASPSISYDRFVLYADYDYIGLSDDAKTKNGILVPVGTKVKGELDLAVGTYGGGYRFDTFGKNTIDVLIGAQLTDLEPKIKSRVRRSATRATSRTPS